MSNRRREQLRMAKEGREPGGFFAFPKVVLESRQFAELSPYAVKLMMDMASQWQPGRNGYLSASWSLMSERGWKSKDTLNKSLRELEAGGWLIRTKQGGRRVCTLFAFTFFRIDDHLPDKPLDIRPTVGPLGYWKGAAEPVKKIDSLAPPHGAKA